MITLGSMWFKLIPFAVYLVWRLPHWVRRDRTWQRELVIAALAWSCVAILDATMRPFVLSLTTPIRDRSLIPVRSSFDLIVYSTPDEAAYNIVGNIALFVPFGLLLSIAFPATRSARGIAWRAAIVSLGIELFQFVTSARAFDIDDIILNTIGATIGYGVFTLVDRLLRRSDGPDRFMHRLMERVERNASNKPLLALAAPSLIVAALLGVLIGATIFRATTNAAGVDRAAESTVPSGHVVTGQNFGQWRAVLVAEGSAPADDGDSAPLTLYVAQRVVFGRYEDGDGDLGRDETGASCHLTVTEYNLESGTLPAIMVFGRNDRQAALARITWNSETLELAIPEGPEFLVGTEVDLATASGDGLREAELISASGDTVVTCE